MSWHQLPIQQPLASVPMSHLDSGQVEMRIKEMLMKSLKFKRKKTNQFSVSQLHMVLHMPINRKYWQKWNTHNFLYFFAFLTRAVVPGVDGINAVVSKPFQHRFVNTCKNVRKCRSLIYHKCTSSDLKHVSEHTSIPRTSSQNHKRSDYRCTPITHLNESPVANSFNFQ